MGLRNRHGEFLQSMLSHAAWIQERYCCLCRALGMRSGRAFVLDPAQWNLAMQGSMMRVMVYFEFEGVTVGPLKKRHVVSIRADDLLSRRRGLPRIPVKAKLSDMHFTLEWLDAWFKLNITYQFLPTTLAAL